jgi:uncharacterized protein (TIGR02271 family)
MYDALNAECDEEDGSMPRPIDWDQARTTYQQRWRQRAGSGGGRWEDVEPGYRYGYEMAGADHYRGRAWSDAEPELRAGYPAWSRHAGHQADDNAWETVKESVQDAWEHATGRAGGGAQERAALDSGETKQEIRVPIVEERLTVEKRAGQTGEVNIHRRVVEEQQSAPVELRREEVHVERREVEARPLQPGEEATFDEGTIRVPVRGEEAVVSKEAVVTGEVVVNKEQTTERQEVRDTVRRQEVDVDEDYERFRSGYRQDFDRSTTAGAATWDEAEPRYRYGYAAARDARYAGRDFEEVEPELRHDWEASYGGADPWERLRREIRQGWDRVRHG